MQALLKGSFFSFDLVVHFKKNIRDYNSFYICGFPDGIPADMFCNGDDGVWIQVLQSHQERKRLCHKRQRGIYGLCHVTFLYNNVHNLFLSIMTLTEYIARLGEYFRSVDTYNDAFIVKVMFPSQWVAESSSDGRIRVVRSETNNYEWFFYCDTSKGVSIEEVFDFIIDTITYNTDMKAKIDLLKVKVEELKEFFADRTLEELMTLQFVTNQPLGDMPKPIDNGKNKADKKRGRPRKTDNKPVETVAKTGKKRGRPRKTEGKPDEKEENITENDAA